MNKWYRFGLRVAIYALGLLSLAFSVVFSINSRLGVSPVNSFPYVFHRIILSRFPESTLTLGAGVTAFFCFYILLQILILRREFNPLNLFQILFSTLFGYFVNFARLVVGDFSLPGYAGQLCMLGISIFLIGLGLALYLNVRLVPMPAEGFLGAIVSRSRGRLELHRLKVLVDCLVVGTGAILSFVFIGDVYGIREGTVITAIMAGKALGWIQKPLLPWFQRLCSSPVSQKPSEDPGVYVGTEEQFAGQPARP
ncbi:hypothetical protein AU468_05890 [Alkalispirochaeta sphaeroplastigenens]|uniref:Membrane protein YczE n=1 Tax=Alkalispirochaeta sphaeroplastigenens TaxID=1187066 RepID=A0A2S4JU86_9SPIO|nr:DUF6198 family protein [Alkalispirochaeta sphaeroplastigenens]POR03084.1 hypothetical protein AU468_05890 [Alkalispirochaeta sphaeroplastigenens]